MIVLDSAADGRGDLVDKRLDLFWGNIVEKVGDEQSVRGWESVLVVALRLWRAGTLDIDISSALRLNSRNSWPVLCKDGRFGDGDGTSGDWCESLCRGLWDLKSETSEGEPGEG